MQLMTWIFLHYDLIGTLWFNRNNNINVIDNIIYIYIYIFYFIL